jgi:hypothetical protein
VSYSLDDVLPPRKAQYIDGNPVAWMTVGHSLWVVGSALAGCVGAGGWWFALAGVHLLALIVIAGAWASRVSSLVAARAVAWVSTPLLGSAAALLIIAFVGSVWSLVTYEDPEFEASFAPIFAGLSLVAILILSVPVVGAFLASVSHAHRVRGV